MSQVRDCNCNAHAVDPGCPEHDDDCLAYWKRLALKVIDERNQGLIELTREKHQAEWERADSRTRYQTLARERDYLSKALEELKTEYDHVYREHAKAASLLTGIQHDYNRLAKELTAAEKKLNAAKKEIENAHEALALEAATERGDFDRTVRSEGALVVKINANASRRNFADAQLEEANNKLDKLEVAMVMMKEALIGSRIWFRERDEEGNVNPGEPSGTSYSHAQLRIMIDSALAFAEENKRVGPITALQDRIKELRALLDEASRGCTINHPHTGVCVGCFTEEHNRVISERDTATAEIVRLRECNQNWSEVRNKLEARIVMMKTTSQRAIELLAKI